MNPLEYEGAVAIREQRSLCVVRSSLISVFLFFISIATDVLVRIACATSFQPRSHLNLTGNVGNDEGGIRPFDRTLCGF